MTSLASEDAHPTARWAARWALVAAIPGWLFAAWQSTAVWPYFSDDAFISLRYAARLLAGHGLTFTDGERVEGYSNLLWVLACAGLGAFGLDLVTAARLLGGLCTCAALFWLARALRPHDLRTTALAALGPLLAAASQPVLAWTLGGLEGPMVMAGLAWGYAGLSRRLANAPVDAWSTRDLVRCGLPFALVCLCRPDGPLWVATIALGLALATLRAGAAATLRPVLAFAALPVAAVLGQLAFRLAYYDDWVPNTAHVKAALDLRALPAGLAYVRGALTATTGLLVLAGLGAITLLWHRRHRTAALLTILPTLAWFGYLAVIGGDHFPGRRLAHGAIVPLALLGAGGLRVLARGPSRLLLALALGLTASAADAWRARRDAQTAELQQEVWEWRGEAIGRVLRAAFADRQPLLAVDAAGALPFAANLPTLDLLGLCDRTIATTPPPEWLRTVRPGTPLPPGHLHGNGRYVMDRAPDLMLFSSPPGLPLPVFVSAAEFESDPRFADGYRCVRIDCGPPPPRATSSEPLVAVLWVRLDGRVGITRTADRVAIPAWLFGSLALSEPLTRRYQVLPSDPAETARFYDRLNAVGAWLTDRSAVAVAAADGHLQLELRSSAPATLRVPLPAGTWRPRVVPEGCPITLRSGGNAADDGLVVADDGPLELTLAPAPGAELPVRCDRIEWLRATPR